MKALKDILSSEKGTLALVFLICLTIALCLGKLNQDGYLETALWVFGIYVGGKTVQGVTIGSKGKS